MAEVVTKPVHKSTLADVIDRRATLPLVRSRRPVSEALPTTKLTAAAQTPEPAPAAARELSDIEQFFDALGRDRGVEFLAEYKGDMEQLLRRGAPTPCLGPHGMARSTPCEPVRRYRVLRLLLYLAKQ